MTELLLGFIIGMRHALDADHVSAVATLVVRKPNSIQESIKIGVSWGIGHTVTLMMFSLFFLLSGIELSQRFASALEWTVGLMLLLLGYDLLRQLRKERVHAHVHRHNNGKFHLHAHKHNSLEITTNHNAHTSHQHQHKRLQWRALFVGIMHGMAGSAALIFIALSSVPSLWYGLIYIFLFGLGTLLGMASLSFAIALPLQFSAQNFEKIYGKLQQVTAVISVGLGGVVVYQQSNWLIG